MQTLKEKFVAIYKKAFKTDEDPTIMDLAKLANVLGAVLNHPQAEQELGKDVINALKKSIKKTRRHTEVNITTLCQEIGWYDTDQQEESK